MGCDNTKRRFGTELQAENFMRVCFADMKIQKLELKAFINLLSTQIKGEKSYLSVVKSHFIDLDDVNEYKEIQILIIPDYSNLPDFIVYSISWAFGFLQKDFNTLSSDLLMIINFLQPFSQITEFKRFLKTYLYFNIIYFTERTNQAILKKLVMVHTDEERDFLITSFNLILSKYNNRRVFNKIYTDVVSKFEKILTIRSQHNKVAITEMKIEESDFDCLNKEFPWLWNFLELRIHIFDNYKDGVDETINNISYLNDDKILNN